MNRLKAALDPASIAIIGASDDPNKVGGRPIHYLQKFGFKGAVYPINPSRKQVQGHPCFEHIHDVPSAPDLAIVALSGESALEAISDCAKLGVKVAIVMGSGFSEADPVEGRKKEARMLETARSSGMRIVGPNSQGLANFGTGAVASFSSMFAEMNSRGGNVAIVSQSGAFSVVPVGFLEQRGIGVRHAHATGNELDLSVGELGIAVAEDPEVKLLMLYLESINSTHHLEELARVALSRQLPVIAVKSGRSEEGRKAAESHTGALATEDRVVDAFFAQHGIWRARNTHELIDATELYLKGWHKPGSRLVSISNSGAFGVMTADAVSESELSLAVLSDETKAKLRAKLPSFASVTNPIDLTAAILTNNRLVKDALDAVSDDQSVDAVVLGLPVSGPGMNIPEFAQNAAAFEKATGKPVMAVATRKNVLETFAAEGIPVFATESDAVSAFSQYVAHKSLMRSAGLLGTASNYRGHVEEAAGKGRMLNEAASLALLKSRGIPVVRHKLCLNEESALVALRDIGGPVVVKGCSSDIAHKSELGLVKVGVTEPEDVRKAFAHMKDTIEDQKLRFDGVLIAALAKGRREMLVGAHRDPVFGPVIVFGDGGKYVEAFRDTQLLLADCNKEVVKERLRSLRIAPLLSGVRNEPPMDVEGLCDIIGRIGELMLDRTARVVSVDLNPVMVGSAGEGCVIVDAVVFEA